MTPSLMVAIEGVTLLFLLVVFSAYILLPRTRPLKKDAFFSLLFTLIGLLSDLIAWTCELGPSPALIQYPSNFISLIMTSVMVSAFGYYTVDLINEQHPLKATAAHVISAVNLVGILVALVAAFFGTVFDISYDNPAPGINTYDDGGLLYEIPVILSALSMLFLFLLTLHHVKELGKRKIVVFAIYFLLPLSASVVELVNEDLLFSYVAISISMCIIYAMLQSNHMNALLVRDKLLSEISYVDQLTGLLNRRACDRDLGQLREDDTVHVVFCDLNGLKRINDEQGYTAGDDFLILFSKIITRISRTNPYTGSAAMSLWSSPAIWTRSNSKKTLPLSVRISTSMPA